MKYKAYTQYKPSNIDWVSEIPKSWEILPAFSVVKNTCIKNVDGAEDNVLSLSYGNIVKRNLDGNFGLLPESFNTYQIVSKGNIILRLTDLQNDKKSLRVGYVTEKGIITSAYLNLACLKSIEPKYAYFLLHSYDLTKVFYGMGGGLRQSMKFEDLKRLPIIIPFCSEQLSIVQFLDAETAKIDQLIRKQTQLIVLLKEKQQAAICDVVTKGLNPDVKLKISGNEWLGEVPEHWGVSRIGWLCKVGNGSTPNRDNQSYWSSGDYPWLNSSKVNDDIVTSAEQFVTSKALLECSLPLVKKGSVIIAITGEGKTRGISALLMMNATINQHIAYITPLSNNKILPEYLHLWLQSKYEQIRFESSGGGSTKAAITCSDVRKYIIPLPPLNEQEVIVADVEIKKRRFNTLVKYCEQQISLLKERRSALISAAVTGKIDVRNWQPDAKDAA